MKFGSVSLAQMRSSALGPWVARLGLMGVVVGAAFFLGPQLPHEQHLAFAVGQRGAKRLEVHWTPASEVEPQGGFSMNLGSQATEMIRHTTDLPNGDYRFEIAVTHPPEPARALAEPGASETTNYVRRVTLEGGATTIHLP